MALVVGLSAGCRDNKPAAGPAHFDDAVARKMVLDHYERTQNPISVPSGMSLLPVGEDFRVVLVPLRIQPASRAAWVAGIGKYSLKPLDINSLQTAFLNSYPPCNDSEERLKAATQFVELLSYEGLTVAPPATVIRKLEDIPAFEKSPPDPDITSAIRPPYETSDRELVLFTYRQAGGVVCRYKFTFKEDGRLHRASRSILDEGVGSARYFR